MLAVTVAVGHGAAQPLLHPFTHLFINYQLEVCWEPGHSGRRREHDLQQVLAGPPFTCTIGMPCIHGAPTALGKPVGRSHVEHHFLLVALSVSHSSPLPGITCLLSHRAQAQSLQDLRGSEVSRAPLPAAGLSISFSISGVGKTAEIERIHEC